MAIASVLELPTCGNLKNCGFWLFWLHFFFPPMQSSISWSLPSTATNTQMPLDKMEHMVETPKKILPFHMGLSRSWVQSHSHLWFQRGLHHQTPPGWCRGLAWEYMRNGIFTASSEKEHWFLQDVFSISDQSRREFLYDWCSHTDAGETSSNSQAVRPCLHFWLIHWTEAAAQTPTIISNFIVSHY